MGPITTESVNPVVFLVTGYSGAIEQAFVAKGHRVACQVCIAVYWIDFTILSRDGNIWHVPPTEMKAVILMTARAMFCITRQSLVVEDARCLVLHIPGVRSTMLPAQPYRYW